LEARLPAKTTVALVSVASPSTAFSTQVLTRLESAVVGGGKLVVVDRSYLDKVREEQGFQLSGEVDDESAKSIGKLLGAGAIVTGALADLGDVYSLTLKGSQRREYVERGICTEVQRRYAGFYPTR
jgi:hypothetical protein